MQTRFSKCQRSIRLEFRGSDSSWVERIKETSLRKWTGRILKREPDETDHLQPKEACKLIRQKDLNRIVQFWMNFHVWLKCNPEINLKNEFMLSHDQLDVSAMVTGLKRSLCKLPYSKLSKNLVSQSTKFAVGWRGFTQEVKEIG